MIYAVETVSHYVAEDFDKLLNGVIDRWQAQGLEVEVQYSTVQTRNAGVPQHNALVIAKRASA